MKNTLLTNLFWLGKNDLFFVLLFFIEEKIEKE